MINGSTSQSPPSPPFCQRTGGGRRIFAIVAGLVLLTLLAAISVFLIWAYARRGHFYPKHKGFIRFALCQYDTPPGDIERNIGIALENASQAAQHGADFVVFPEFSFSAMCDVSSGLACYNVLEREELASRLLGFTRRNGCYLLFNHPFAKEAVTGETNVFNKSSLIGPDGAVCAEYCKQKMALIDSVCGFSPGDTDIIARLPFGNIGLMICKDSKFPGKFPSFGKADLVVIQFAHIVNWGDADPPVGLQDPIAEAPTNIQSVVELVSSAFHKPVLMVNKTGLEDLYAYVGGSRVIAADGKTVFLADSCREIVYADFQLDGKGRIDRNKPPIVPESPTDYPGATRLDRLFGFLRRLAVRLP